MPTSPKEIPLLPQKEVKVLSLPKKERIESTVDISDVEDDKAQLLGPAIDQHYRQRKLS